MVFIKRDSKRWVKKVSKAFKKFKFNEFKNNSIKEDFNKTIKPLIGFLKSFKKVI